MYDLQKADMWKRISAWLFDFILIGIVMTGLLWIFALVFNTDSYISDYNSAMEEYKTEFGLQTSMGREEYEALSQEAKFQYQQIKSRLWYNHEMLLNLWLLIASLTITLSHFLMEFIIPLIFGNGQTLGKKIFSIGVMRSDGVRITPLQLFVRSVLGKGTAETLIPVFILIMLVLGTTGIVGIAVLAAILLSEIVLLVATKTRTPIHDVMAGTVTVDMTSQMIFDTPEALLAYKQKIHAEMVNDIKEQSAGA